MTKIIEKTLDGKYALTSPFGWRINPVTGKSEGHIGADYGTYGVNLPVKALEDGFVNTSALSGSAGNYIQIDYPRLGMNVRYLHLDSRNVEYGANVKKGDIIGYVGTTGQSTGIHLHLDLRPYVPVTYEALEYIDPETYNYVEAIEPEPTPVDPFPGVTDEELAKRVWLGEFGNGEDRKNALGIRYNAVQELVSQGIGKPNNNTKEQVTNKYGEVFKINDVVVPTTNYSYKGTKVVQYDKSYVITEFNSENYERAVLKAKRGNELETWAGMHIDNIKKI